MKSSNSSTLNRCIGENSPHKQRSPPEDMADDCAGARHLDVKAPMSQLTVCSQCGFAQWRRKELLRKGGKIPLLKQYCSVCCPQFSQLNYQNLS